MADLVAMAERFVPIALAIKEAVGKAESNVRECQEIKRVSSQLLLDLQRKGTMKTNSRVRHALDDLEKTLWLALRLIRACQKKDQNFVQRLFMADDLANQLLQVKVDISLKLGAANFAINMARNAADAAHPPPQLQQHRRREGHGDRGRERDGQMPRAHAHRTPAPIMHAWPAMLRPGTKPKHVQMPNAHHQIGGRQKPVAHEHQRPVAHQYQHQRPVAQAQHQRPVAHQHQHHRPVAHQYQQRPVAAQAQHQRPAHQRPVEQAHREVPAHAHRRRHENPAQLKR